MFCHLPVFDTLCTSCTYALWVTDPSHPLGTLTPMGVRVVEVAMTVDIGPGTLEARGQ